MRRGSGARSIVGVLLSCPYRASADSRFTGTRDRFTRPSANAKISCTRSIAVPVGFTGGVRSRSSTGTRLPSGTTSSSARPAPSPDRRGTSPLATASYRRRSAAVRASGTYRTGTETPGSSTRFFLGHVTARLNSATGTSANVPYASACSSVRHSTDTRRTLASAGTRSTIFP